MVKVSGQQLASRETQKLTSKNEDVKLKVIEHFKAKHRPGLHPDLYHEHKDHKFEYALHLYSSQTHKHSHDEHQLHLDVHIPIKYFVQTKSQVPQRNLVSMESIQRRN